MALVGQLVDGFFIALVLLLTYRTFFGASPVNEKRTERWHNELRSLATLLKELITEASAASSNLDRSLLKRKEELHALLLQVEEAQRGVQQIARHATAHTAAHTEQPKRSEEASNTLPNESWSTKPFRTLSPLREAPTQERPTQKRSATNESLLPIDEARDTVSLSTRNQPRKVLGNRIEMERAPASSSSQSAAYRIARRLLAQGIEIHVVARKVELPIAEVRAIEAVMRREEEVESAPELVEAPVKRASKRLVRRESERAQSKKTSSEEFRSERRERTKERQKAQASGIMRERVTL